MALPFDHWDFEFSKNFDQYHWDFEFTKIFFFFWCSLSGSIQGSLANSAELRAEKRGAYYALMKNPDNQCVKYQQAQQQTEEDDLEMQHLLPVCDSNNSDFESNEQDDEITEHDDDENENADDLDSEVIHLWI